MIFFVFLGDKLKFATKTNITSGPRTYEKGKNFQLNSSMALADQKIACLTRESNTLKEEQSKCIKSNEMLKKQVSFCYLLSFVEDFFSTLWFIK